jgi:transposase-like protein
MRSIAEVDLNPSVEGHTMTVRKLKAVPRRLEALVAQDRDLLKALVKEALEQVLQSEMTEFLGAGPGERAEGRNGYRAGYYGRGLITRVGKIELRVPRDRNGEFSTALFERFQRSEKALVSALAEMYIQGVSTRKVKAITEELCGHSFSASAISAINKGLDESLTKFARRKLTEDYPYLILDARYEKVREDGVIQSQALLVAIGINWEGKRQILGVELANRESQTSWREFLLALRQRGLTGVEFVVSDDHAGLKKAIAEIVPEAAWQRCYVHFLRNALDYLPRKADDDCLQELRWLYERRNLAEAQRDLAAWLGRWQKKYPKLTDLGRGAHRLDADLLSPAAAAPPTLEEHQHARAAERGVAAADAGRADLPQCSELPPVDARAVRRNPRGLARRQSLHQHGFAARAAQGAA